ncbi:MAG TPA: hypothetical protein VGK50_00455 [Coriobacteriia bacterium]|jgi:hypothetical protein
MAIAGRCRICGQNVWLNDQWGCVNGHAWTEIGDWYDPATGMAVTPYWLQPQTPAPVDAPAPVAPPAEVPAAPPAEVPVPVTAPVAEPPVPPAVEPPAAPPALATRDALLPAILAAFAAYPGYNVRYGTDTDVVIDNRVADASWGTGKKKVEYEAILKAVEGERTLYFWEMLKEQGAGVSFGGFESESYSTFGAKRWGKTKEVVVGPGGKAMDYEWDYAATRRIVEDVAARGGWKVKVVLRKKSAQW